MSKFVPKVSIILPTYNGAKFIRQSIESCLNQTYQNIELIIVDDCSTDNTFAIISSYADKRLKYFKHWKNLGLPKALNTGFSHATGDYLTWTSDDNFYSEDAIEKELDFLLDNKCSFVFCDFYRFRNEKTSELKLIKLPDTVNMDKKNEVGACFLYTRKVKDTVGDFDPEAELAEDYDYWIRVSKEFAMYHLAEPLYYYREHVNSLSLNRPPIEGQVSEILVRCKNQLSYDSSLANLVDLIAQTYPQYFGIKSLAKTLLRRKIKRKLLDLQTGKLSFNEAKLALRSMNKRS